MPILMRILNVALFNSPNIYSQSIDSVWVDSTLVKPMWKNFISQFTSEWNSVILFVSILLMSQSADLLTLAVNCDARCGYQFPHSSWSR
jgi:hypothetical protein